MSGFDWDDMRVFLAIRRSGSLRAAAARLQVSQSTVSRRLEGLETRLGARLFLRLSGGLRLTPAGEAIAERAEEAETTMLQIERDILGRDAALEGRIVLSMPPPLAAGFLMRELAVFAEQHPLIRVELVSTYDLADLAGREADLAIRLGGSPEEHLVGRRLPDFASAVYATPAYLEAHCLNGPRADARWIGWMDAARMRHWIRAGPFPDCALGWIMPDIASQTAAAEAGMGLASLPCVFGDASGDLVRVPPGAVISRLPAWILTHADLRSTERVRVCLRFIAEALARRSAELTGE